MRVFKILPILLLGACAHHAADATKPVTTVQTPANKEKKAGDEAGTPANLPKGPATKPGSVSEDEANMLRIGPGVTNLPDDNDFKATNPNLSRKGNEGAVIATPPSDKTTGPATKPKE